MKVYDTTNKLAQEIKDSEEYKEYKRAKEYIKNRPDLKTQIENFEKLRYDVQVATLQGVEADKTKALKMQQVYIEIIKNPEIKRYFDVELRFNVMLSTVNKTIGDAVKDVLAW